jgi:hypothetical protein
MSAAVIAAVNCVEDTNDVVRLAPFHWTTEPLMKPVPLIVSVNPALPAVVETGLKPVVPGTGLLPALIVKVLALDVPPPGVGLNTITEAVPAVAMSAVVIAAVNCVEVTNDVIRSAPFHFTTEPLMKPLPVTVSVNPAPPAVVDAGLRPVVAGTGLLPPLVVYCTDALDVEAPTRTFIAFPTVR